MRFSKLCAATTLTMAASQVPAFDTGPHFYVTGQACTDAGFGTFATQVTQFENWLVDYYANDPLYPDSGPLHLLHFDNLTTTRKVKVYWSKLVANCKAAFEADATANDPFKALCHLGYSLHAVQDFYSHSNWADVYPSTATVYKSKTYFQAVPPDNATNIFTGKYPKDAAINAGNANTYHGNYGWGLNKDSYSRPGYSDAYVYAYAATRQWLEAVKGWVNAQRPGFWDQMRDYTNAGLSATLTQNLWYQYRISEWTRLPDANPSPFPTYNDGRWNGEFSGAITMFATAAANFISTTDAFTEAVTANRWYRDLAGGLDQLGNEGDPIPGLPAMPNVALNKRVVYLRTVSAADLTTWSCDPLTDLRDPDMLADLWAQETFSYPGYTAQFTEACRQITNAGSTNWLALAIVDKSQRSVGVLYRLHDEDANSLLNPLVTDQFMDIKAGPGFLFNFQFDTANHRCTGDLTGKFDSAANTYTDSGNEPAGRASVTLYITEYLIDEGDCPQGVLHGSLFFEDYMGDLPSYATVEIRDLLGFPLSSHQVSLNPMGEFDLNFPYADGTYFISVKHSHWLRKTELVSTSDCATFELALTNGDCDGDNEVGIGDFALISMSFGLEVGDPGSIAGADLNGDLGIDIGDYAILSSNFGLFGDD